VCEKANGCSTSYAIAAACGRTLSGARVSCTGAVPAALRRCTSQSHEAHVQVGLMDISATALAISLKV
jgi:hypothetical protein